jgi:WD40 repeat protein/serine/threonine protein kinase
VSSQVEIVCACSLRVAVTADQVGAETVCPECGAPIAITWGTFLEAASDKTLLFQASDSEDIPEEWKPGDVLLDQYEVQSVLGHGAMGTVYKVFHRTWNQYVAVKSPLPGVIERAGGIYNFEHECETWTRLAPHPNVVACFYARRLGGIPRVFAEYVDGGTLLQWMEERSLYRGEPADVLGRILRIAVQMAWGLHHAHCSGVIHQDVKPANIMMTAGGLPKVTDFGLARHTAVSMDTAETSESSSRHAITGMTPAYCSPEQAAKDTITFKTDMWSWALSVFQLFTYRAVWRVGSAAPIALEKVLRRPWQSEVAPAMPPLLVDLLRDCFRLDPSERPADMREAALRVVAAYEDALGEVFPIAEPPRITSSGDTMNNRAVSLMDFGRVQQAQQVWRKALKENPGHPECTFNGALIQWRSSAATDIEAVEQLSVAVNARPGEMLPHFLLARLHLERGEVQQAESHLQRMEEVQPGAEYAQQMRKLAEAAGEGRAALDAWPGHAGGVACVAVAPQWGLVISGGEDNGILVRDVHSGETRHALLEHTNTVRALAVSPDGRRLASAGLDRRLKIWDLDTGVCLETRQSEYSRPCGLVWLKESGRLVSAGVDFIRVYRWEEGLQLEAETLLRGGVSAVAADGTGGRLFAASPGGPIQVLQLDTLQPLEKVNEGTTAFRHLDFDSESRALAATAVDNVVHIFYLGEPDEAPRALRGHRGEVGAALLSQGGGRVISVGKDRALRLWDTVKARCLWTAPTASGALCVAFDATRGVAFAGLANGSVQSFRMAVDTVFPEAPLMICRSYGTEHVIALERDYRDFLAEAAAHHKAGRYDEAADAIRRLRGRAGQRGRKEAIAAWMHLYPKLTRTELCGLMDSGEWSGHEGTVHAVVSSFNGRYVLSGGADAAVRVWDAEKGRLQRQFEGHAAAVRTLALSDDQQALVSGSDDATLRLWQVRTGECLRTLDHPGGAPEAVALSPDGRFVASAGWELSVWDLKHGQKAGALEGHEGGNSAVLWARSNRFIVSGGADGRIKFWNPATGQRAAQLKSPSGPVHALALSLDERLLAAASGNPWDRRGKVSVWNTDTGQAVCEYAGHESPVALVAITSDGRVCLSAGSDGVLHLWNAATGEGIRTHRLAGENPTAASLSVDASRYFHVRGDGIVRALLLDWELDAKVRPTMEALRRNADILARGLQPLLNRRYDLPRADSQGGWPLVPGPFRAPEEATALRLAYLAGCAGCAGLRPEHMIARFRALAAEAAAQAAKKS